MAGTQASFVVLKDSTGLLTSPITTFIYDVDGKQKTATDARRNVTTNDYDIMERLIKTTDAQGGVTRYVYDKSGNLV